MTGPTDIAAAHAGALARAWVAFELAAPTARARELARDRALLWLQIEAGIPVDIPQMVELELDLVISLALAQPAPAQLVPATEPPALASPMAPVTPPTARDTAAAAPTLLQVATDHAPPPAPVPAAPPAPVPVRAAPAQRPQSVTIPPPAPARPRRAKLRAVPDLPEDHAVEADRSNRLPFTFLLLAVAWGSSFMFIKYGLRGFSPSTIVCLQSIVASVVLWAYIKGAAALGASAGIDDERPRVRDVIGLGLLTPLGYLLIVWGEQFVDSGIAAILTATEPLWTLLLLRLVVGRARWNPIQLLGMFIGLGGVAMLGYGQGTVAGGVRIIGLVALLGSALLYAGLAVHVARNLGRVWYIRTAAWSCTMMALVTAPLTVRDLPPVADWRTDSVVAVVMLGLFDSALGYLLFYRLVSRIGPVRAAQVNYLLPVIAVLCGAVFLGEPAEMLSLVAMAFILAGVWMGSDEHGHEALHDELDALDEDGEEAHESGHLEPASRTAA